MGKFVSKTNLSYVWSKIKSLLGNKQDKITSSNKLSKDLVSGLGTASTVNTGTSNGNVPVIGTNGKLPSSVIPASAITDTFVANSQSAMLGLSSAEVGDVCVRTDLNKSFILKATPYSTLANWQELLTPTDAVTSVNGQTGAVSLSIPTGAAASKGVVTTVDTSANLPTSNAVKTFVEGKGYATQTELSTVVSDTYLVGQTADSTQKLYLVGTSSSSQMTGLGNYAGTYVKGNEVYSYGSPAMTTGNSQTVTGKKNFTGGLTVNGVDVATTSGTVATATNATKLNNQSASYYLNYNNLSNKPTIPDTSNMATTNTNQTISGIKTHTNGLVVSGRSAGGGDDEGITVAWASNGYAGVCLGSPSARRSVFYLKDGASGTSAPYWRYAGSGFSYDLYHPGKAGTIATTSDIPKLVTLTQAEYDALTTKDANTYYFIKE